MITLSDSLKKRILKHEEEINNYQFIPIYADLNSDYFEVTTGYFTDMMLSIGIDPAEYIGRLPEFYMCGSQATEYAIPNRITDIPQWAFARCEKLEEISIPETVAYIWSYAFFDCKSLKNIEFPDRLLVLSNNALEGCTSLERVNIPRDLASLGEQAFKDCTGLKSLALENCFLQALPTQVCQGCTNLKTVSLPQTIKSIEYQAFEECESLEEIRFAGTTAQWKEIHKDKLWISNNSTQIRCVDGTLMSNQG